MGVLSFKPERLSVTPCAEGAKIREKIFLEHYRALMGSALQFTRGQRERAEDLVHDAFVQFQMKQVNVAAVDNIRSYLSGMLRNLYLLQVRRAARYPMQQLSLLDHDSADIGLRAQSPVDQLQSADLLLRACHFVCRRKETSVPASILILRFFHGYYTDEVCCLAGAQRRQVNKWLVKGRNETKDHIAKPCLLDKTGPIPVGLPTHSSRTFLAYLRGLIFDSCTTPCSILERGEEATLAQALAHLVSCRRCLERRSGGLGLPNIKERMMDDISSGNDAEAGGVHEMEVRGPFSRWRYGNDPPGRLRRAYRERMREISEHRPAELSIVFDGETHATLLLNGTLNTLNLSLEKRQCPDSVAILSDQELCLLMLDRSEIECAERKVFLLRLSEGRRLQVTIVPEFRGPSLQVAYHDPELVSVHHSVQSGGDAAPGDEIAPGLPAREDQGPASILLRWQRRIRRALVRFEISKMNPTLATALVLAAVSSVLLVIGVQQQRHKAVVDVLRRATAAEWSSRAMTEPGVIRQTVVIRTSHRALERTIYRDARGIRRARRKSLSPDDEQLKTRLADAGVAWETPLSVADYSMWRQHSQIARDAVANSGKHLLKLISTPAGEGPVLRESLTVRDSDLHAIERTIEFRDSGTIEIAELSYDVLPWASADPGWFEPLSGPTSTDAPGILSVNRSTLPHLLSDLELDESELEVRIALHQLHADSGERIRVSRGRVGIQIKGVVDTDVRKQELVSHLERLPHVSLSLLSVEEINSHSGIGSPFDTSQPVQFYSVEAQASPLEAYLREKSLPTDQLASISHNLLNGALRIQQAEVHFSELQPRFHTAYQLSTNLRAQLAALSRSYLEVVSAGLDANEKILRSVGLADGTDADISFQSASSAEDMDAEIQRYQQLCRELISGGAEQTRSAAAIAHELMNTRVRLQGRLEKLSEVVPAIPNR